MTVKNGERLAKYEESKTALRQRAQDSATQD